MKMAKNLTLIAALTLAFASMAQAQEAAPAPEAKPDNEVSYNVAFVSDYRYRGISQTRLKPALQGGADYVNNPTGFYAGTWLTNIKWVKDGGGDGSVEWDIYAGKRGAISDAISYDVGGLYYYYPSNKLNPSANTFELYGQLSAGPFLIKYSRSTTNLFGFADSKNSGYFDAQINQEIADGYIVNLHLGRQNVKNNDAASYNDYKIGVTKDFGVVSVSLAAVSANTNAYTGKGKDLGKTGAVLTISKIF
ncbi:TorF family putative porin [Duganella sp. BuS-21]|uniref:TorF family putative porin n=1 Tax=Duganella sp. BuS-21 TaxID=2943848 RepID=UPI0035A576F5